MPPVPPFPWFDVVIILMLIALNGVFAMAEMAIVSSRKPRLKAMAKQWDPLESTCRHASLSIL